MGRPHRIQPAGHVFHVINRGNGGGIVFRNNGDYQAFLNLLAIAKGKFAIEVFAFCLMPNHFHIVVRLGCDGVLSAFMHWWEMTHVHRYHERYGSHGHVWQGRFKSFLIQEDTHLLIVLRYVLRNPLRAGLVRHTSHWRWSSLHHLHLVDRWPVQVNGDWSEWLEQPLFPHELSCVRACVNRQTPFGSIGTHIQSTTPNGYRSALVAEETRRNSAG